MERDDGVLTVVLPAGQAHVPDHTYHPTTWHKGVITGLPDVVQLAKKLFVIRNVAHLIRVIAVVLQRPVRR